MKRGADLRDRRSKKIVRVSKEFAFLQTAAEERAGAARYFGKMPDDNPKRGYKQSIGRENVDGKEVENLNEEINEEMTDKEFQAVLEAIKGYAQETQSIEKTIALIERMQGKEKEPTSSTK